MGKSSLMNRTRVRLQRAGVAVAALDLTAVGQNVTPKEWYDGLLAELGADLGLEGALKEFWIKDGAGLGPMQRFFEAIRRVVLPALPAEQPLVIFVDEIDAVRSL